MNELRQTADSSPDNSHQFSQENASDHIHLLSFEPRFQRQLDRVADKGVVPTEVVPGEQTKPAQDPVQLLKPGEEAKPGDTKPGEDTKPGAQPAKGEQAKPGESAKPPELSPCPISPEYDQILLRAYHNMYEPHLLGDFSQVRTKYDCQIKNVDDAVRFAAEVLNGTTDPYNSIFDKKQSEDRAKDAQGVWRGFGFTFSNKIDVEGKPGLPSVLRIEGAIPKSPVEKNGIKPGDFIVAVDGVSLAGKPFDEAFSLVKSDAAKKFTMQRGADRYEVNLTPEDLDKPAVTEKRLDNNIAYIKVSTFGQSDTAQELQDALKKHLDADAYIIDLRQNPGGFFDEAIRAASLFVKEGTVVSVRQRVAPAAGDTDPSKLVPKPNYEKTSYDLNATHLIKSSVDEANGSKSSSSSERLPDLVDKPTVILVDHESASSSEVFTGALKDHGDAVVVGTKTYGKGIGQMNYYNMPGGSTLRVTNFHYFTPNGFWAGDANKTRIGITPDVIVANPLPAERGSEKDLQLKEAVQQVNKKLGRP
ncbi:MAG: S41 family peptidase [Candidatus Melainabacteria bacterium]|nr:S41 family peptidase [Candidatus Melainabacteria bacterium]